MHDAFRVYSLVCMLVSVALERFREGPVEFASGAAEPERMTCSRCTQGAVQHEIHLDMPIEGLSVGESAGGKLQIAAGKQWSLDSSVDGAGKSIANGVVLGDGDGTVPLISLGYMCASAWQSGDLNPSGMKVWPCCSLLCNIHLCACASCQRMFSYSLLHLTLLTLRGASFLCVWLDTGPPMVANYFRHLLL